MKKRTGIERLKVRYGRLFVVPWCIGFLLFFLIPLLSSIGYAFSDVSLISENHMTFAGLKHFRHLLLEDPNYVDNIRDAVGSFLYSLPVIIVLSMAFALILNQKFRGRLLARAVFFLPVIIASGVVMQYVLGTDSTGGQQVLNTMLGGEAQSYSGLRFDEILIGLGLPEGVTTLLADYITRIFNLVWSCGIQILLFVAGLQTIPDQLHEVSLIEGATAWEEFWFVTFPMLGNVTFLVIVYTMVDLFTAFDNPVMIQAYQRIAGSSVYDESSAMLWGYFLIAGLLGGIVIALYNRILMRKWQ